MGIWVQVDRPRNLVVGSVLAALAVSVSAQEEAPALEEVVVTGSYLYTGVESPSPVTVFDGEELMFQANPDMLTFFFDNVTQNFSADIGAQTAANGNMGARSIRNAEINLLGLGGENTLVLLNGRRTINYPAPDFNGWNSTDINSMVPRIAIQRTEIVLDGGSAIFGSDPVGGVVNFITRNSFRGFDFSLDTRINDVDPSAKNYTLGALWGAGNDRTNMIAAIEFTQTDRILLSEIEGEDNPNPDVTPETGTGLEDLTGLNFDGTPQGMGMGAITPTWVDPDCGNPAFGAPLFAKYPSYDDGDDLRVADAMNPATSCSQPDGYDPSQFLQNNVKQLSFFLAADHQISDSLSINFEVNYSRQRFDDISAWGDNNAANWLTSPANRGLAIPTTHPGYMRAVSLDPTFGRIPGMGMAPPTTVPVFMEGETLPFNSTMPAYNRSDLFRIAFGIEGALPGTSNWQWHVDTSAAYNQVENGLRDMIVVNYALAMQGYGGPSCLVNPVDDPLGTLAGVGDCHYYNPFMSAALPDAAANGLANNAEMLEWLIPNREDTFTGEFWSADFLITGEFGELPGGPVGVAAGIGYRHDFNGRDSDFLSTSSLLATVANYNDWTGDQDVESIYFEFALPVHENIDVQVAARNEQYVGGFSETTPKIAAIWRATDSLSVRGSFGRSFRGPSVSQSAAETLIGGMGMSTVTIDGTTYGMGGMGPAFPFFTLPNANLRPQTSDNASIGFDYQVNERITTGASWISVEFRDRIGAPPAPTTLNNAACLNTDVDGIPILSGGNLTYVSVADGGCVVPADPTLALTAANIGSVQTIVTNLDYLNAEFLDLRASFLFDTPYGPLTFSPSATITTKYQFPNTDGAVAGNDFACMNNICDGLGRDFAGGMGGGFVGVTDMPRWQGSFPLRLSVGGNQNIALTARYRDSINQDTRDLTTANAAVFFHQGGQWTTSLNYTYRFGSGGSLAFAVNNLTATDPPAMGGQRFNRQQRTFNLQYRHSFEN